MSDTNVAERLKTFIENKGLTYSQFADTCGIPRPSLSQLLTGRNKKISDIMVGQIHNMFPELSIVWLLFGEGAMENSPGKFQTEDSSNGEQDYDEGIFAFDNGTKSGGNKIIFSSVQREGPQISQGNGLKNSQNEPQIVDFKVERLQNKIKELQAQIENLKKNPRKAVQITVYYDDNTFETFFPRDGAY